LNFIRKLEVKRASQIFCKSGAWIRLVLFAHAKATHARFRFEKVLWVGADGINRREGNNYPTVSANLMAKMALFATFKKDSAIWKDLPAEFLWQNGHPKAINVALELGLLDGKGRPACQDAVRQRVRVGASDWGIDRGVVRTDGPSGPDHLGAVGGNLGPLNSRADDYFMERLNALFSAAKLNSRGYRTVESMSAML
jgi:hypothetical protein